MGHRRKIKFDGGKKITWEEKIYRGRKKYFDGREIIECTERKIYLFVRYSSNTVTNALQLFVFIIQTIKLLVFAFFKIENG